MRAHRTPSTTAAVVALAFLALLATSTHTVARGETLAGIASRYGTTVAALAATNGIADPNRIFAGELLQLPVAGAGAGAPAVTAATTTYTVQRGDTLGSIASRSSTSIASLVALNKIARPNLIRVGQLLALPAIASSTPTAPPASGSPARTPAGGATSHVVRAGDTLSGIATRYGIPQSQIVAANGITGDRIYIGQRLLLVPRAATRPTPAPATTLIHVVEARETLSSIAQRYGTTIKAIQDLNGISDPDLIPAGHRLTIPGASPTPSGLVCPIRGPMQHVNDWGFPRSGGRFHEGNDLVAARGTPAVAMVAGTATQVVGLLGGNQVKLVGDDGVTYYYTHLDSFGAAGRVRAGDVIGHVGNTGNAAGGPAHVHFEMHPGGGAAANPYPVVAAVC